MSKLFSSLALLTCIASTLVPASASAARARVIPFSGDLDRSGAPFTGLATLNFALFSCPTACTNDTAPIYVASAGSNNRPFKADDNATGINLTVNGGRFSVLIGDDGMVALPQAVFDERFLFVRIAIKSTTAWVPLTGFQRIAPATSAISAEEAKSFTVRGTLTVNGPIAATGAVSAAALTSSGDITSSAKVTGNTAEFNGVQLKKNGGTTARIGFDAAANGGNDPGEIVHREPSTNVGELWLSSSDDWGSGANNDKIIFGEVGTGTTRHEFVSNGDALHKGSLTVNGDLTVGGSIALNCRDTATSCQDFGNGSVVFLDRIGSFCNQGEFMQGWTIRPGTPCTNTQFRASFRCCSF